MNFFSKFIIIMQILEEFFYYIKKSYMHIIMFTYLSKKKIITKYNKYINNSKIPNGNFLRVKYIF